MIVENIAAGKHALHYAGMDPLGSLMCVSALSEKAYLPFKPLANAEKCGSNVGESVRSRISNLRTSVFGWGAMHYCLRCAHYCPHQALEVGGKPMQKSFQCIFCTYKDGTPLILELQKRDIVKALVERVLYFQSCAIVSEEETVDRWKHIPLFVYILDFVRDEFIGEARCRSRHEACDRDSGW